MPFYDSRQEQQTMKMLSKRVLNGRLGIAEFSHLNCDVNYFTISIEIHNLSNYLYYAGINLVLLRVTRGCMPWLLTKRREKGGENFNHGCSCKFFFM